MSRHYGGRETTNSPDDEIDVLRLQVASLRNLVEAAERLILAQAAALGRPDVVEWVEARRAHDEALAKAIDALSD